MISSTDVVVYNFFYLFFIYYLFTFALYIIYFCFNYSTLLDTYFMSNTGLLFFTSIELYLLCCWEPLLLIRIPAVVAKRRKAIACYLWTRKIWVVVIFWNRSCNMQTCIIVERLLIIFECYSILSNLTFTLVIFLLLKNKQ